MIDRNDFSVEVMILVQLYSCFNFYLLVYAVDFDYLVIGIGFIVKAY